MRKIGLVINRNKPRAIELSRSVREWLEESKKKVEDNTTKSIEELIKDSDLLICLGGDGTILHLASFFVKKSCPVLGINVGSLGFLSEVKAGEAKDEIGRALKGEYEIEERLMMRVRIKKGKEEGEETMRALNDIVIDREGLTRYLKMNILADEEPLMDYSGDGVIVSTPTGSTAYSLSAGGPLIYPTLDSFVVTPLCAHALLMRPIVLPSEKIVRITLVLEKKEERAVVTADGQRRIEVSGNDEILIERSAVRFPLIVSSHRSYLETLREKFGMSDEKE